MKLGVQQRRVLNALQQYPGISSDAAADYTHHDGQGRHLGEMQVSSIMDRLEELGLIDGDNRPVGPSLPVAVGSAGEE